MQGPATPMRWPAAWADPSMLRLVKGTAIDTLLVDNSDEFEGVRQAAEQQGFRVAHPDAPPDGVRVIQGEWPGVKRARNGADAEAGPTGAPWVDSNGWHVRLAKALHPGAKVWVAAAPRTGGYLAAVADAAAYGGRWIVELEDALAADLCGGKAEAAATWKTITQASGFFAAHNEWDAWEPAALVGVISDFNRQSEFFASELLNLLARAGVHFAVLRKDKIVPGAGPGMPGPYGVRALIYADGQPPSAELRTWMQGFVERGGLLITGPGWSEQQSRRVPSPSPNFVLRREGKGLVATGGEAFGDAYAVANDTALLVSHRYDLVRCWNAGAFGSYVAKSPDGKRAVAHLLFYADRGPTEASVRVAGPWRGFAASLVSGPVRATMVRQADAIEVHLPRVQQYVALELTV